MRCLDILHDDVVLFAVNDILLSTNEKFCDKPLKNYLFYYVTVGAPYVVGV